MFQIPNCNISYRFEQFKCRINNVIALISFMQTKHWEYITEFILILNISMIHDFIVFFLCAGLPSIDKCKKARKKLEEAKELAELDVSNIITTQGTSHYNYIWYLYLSGSILSE